MVAAAIATARRLWAGRGGGAEDAEEEEGLEEAEEEEVRQGAMRKVGLNMETGWKQRWAAMARAVHWSAHMRAPAFPGSTMV